LGKSIFKVPLQSAHNFCRHLVWVRTCWMSSRQLGHSA